MERSRKGDQKSWNDLVAETQAIVYSIPKRYRLGDDDAADVFVFTYETLYKNLDRIESGQALPKWLATTSARECLRIIRIKTGAQEGLALDELLASEEATAEEEACRANDAFQLRKNLAQMQSKCRDLLTALYFEEAEVAYSEIASRLEIPVSSIGPTRARCLEKLRRLLEADGYFYEG